MTPTHPAPRRLHGPIALERGSATGLRIDEVYGFVAEIPEVMDGLACHCDCDHRSLLVCFEDGHAAECSICLDEAQVAYRCYRQGMTLDEIRQHVDAVFA